MGYLARDCHLPRKYMDDTNMKVDVFFSYHKCIMSCVCMYVCLCVCVCVCMRIHTYIHTLVHGGACIHAGICRCA
jgi:hypothetical protein